MAKMDERLEKMVERYREINDLMMQSDVVSDRKTMAKLGREQNELTPIVETYEEYNHILNVAVWRSKIKFTAIEKEEILKLLEGKDKDTDNSLSDFMNKRIKKIAKE